MLSTPLARLSTLPMRPQSRPQPPTKPEFRVERDQFRPVSSALAAGVIGLVQLMPAAAQAVPAQAGLEESLRVVDGRLLQLARQQGVTFQVVEPGDDLLQLGVVRSQPHELIGQQLGAIKTFSDELATQLSLRYDAPLRELEPHLKGKPGGWSMGGDPLTSEVSRLREQRERFAIEKIVESGLPVKLFSLPIPAGADDFVAGALRQRSQRPISLEQMARHHGASTPQQVDEFAGWVRDINGERFKQAVSSADWKTTPVDHQSLSLLVPDLWYQQFGNQQVLLDGHDRASLNQWAGPDGRVLASTSGVRGQFFFPVNKVVLRAGAAQGATPVHELGHVLERILEQRDPAFYGPWHDQLEQAWQNSRLNTQPVSGYSQTNPGEFVAEGFAFYTLEPILLKEKDPALFGLIDQMVQRLISFQTAPADRPADHFGSGQPAAKPSEAAQGLQRAPNTSSGRPVGR
ncbi:hypothetical protein JST97_36485 [bacterium]|nr:hypothetical protein [bacterium]